MKNKVFTQSTDQVDSFYEFFVDDIKLGNLMKLLSPNY